MNERYNSCMPALDVYIIFFLPLFISSIIYFKTNHNDSDIIFISMILSITLVFTMSLLPSKLECDEKELVISDLYRGTRVIPLYIIKNIQVEINTYTKRNILRSRYYECHMYIFTDYKKYRYKMIVKKRIAEKIYNTNKSGYYENQVAFIKLKHYIEEQVNIKKSDTILAPNSKIIN